MRQYQDVSKVVLRAFGNLEHETFEETFVRVKALYDAISAHYNVPYEFPEAPLLRWNTELCAEISKLVEELEEWIARDSNA